MRAHCNLLVRAGNDSNHGCEARVAAAEALLHAMGQPTVLMLSAFLVDWCVSNFHFSVRFWCWSGRRVSVSAAAVVRDSATGNWNNSSTIHFVLQQ